MTLDEAIFICSNGGVKPNYDEHGWSRRPTFVFTECFKKIGEGSYRAVYQILNLDGTPTKYVLKIQLSKSDTDNRKEFNIWQSFGKKYKEVFAEVFWISPDGSMSIMEYVPRPPNNFERCPDWAEFYKVVERAFRKYGWEPGREFRIQDIGSNNIFETYDGIKVVDYGNFYAYPY